MRLYVFLPSGASCWLWPVSLQREVESWTHSFTDNQGLDPNNHSAPGVAHFHFRQMLQVKRCHRLNPMNQIVTWSMPENKNEWFTGSYPAYQLVSLFGFSFQPMRLSYFSHTQAKWETHWLNALAFDAYPQASIYYCDLCEWVTNNALTRLCLLCPVQSTLFKT